MCAHLLLVLSPYLNLYFASSLFPFQNFREENKQSYLEKRSVYYGSKIYSFLPLDGVSVFKTSLSVSSDRWLQDI